MLEKYSTPVLKRKTNERKNSLSSITNTKLKPLANEYMMKPLTKNEFDNVLKDYKNKLMN